MAKNNGNFSKKVINKSDNLIIQHIKSYLTTPKHVQNSIFHNSGLLNTVLTSNLNQGTDASFLQKSKVFDNFEKILDSKPAKTKKKVKSKV